VVVNGFDREAEPGGAATEPPSGDAPQSGDRLGSRTAVPDPADPERISGEMLYLAGRPTLRGFIRFVRGHAIPPPREDALVEEWQAARAHVLRLEVDEAGMADHPPITSLPLPQYEPLLTELLRDPLVRYNFNTVPTDIAQVPLDRLVVYQKHIDLGFVGRLREQLGPTPDEARIFRMCLPYDHPQPPVQWSAARQDSFVFVSPSNDLRFLGAMPLQAGNVTGLAPPGALVGVIGIAVGFGTNFLNAIHAENRLILNNGSHRAYALYESGVTHAPCIIQHVSSRDELEVVGPAAVKRTPDLYLRDPRPPMLRDYFDPELRKILPARRRLRQVIVKFQVEETDVPAL